MTMRAWWRRRRKLAHLERMIRAELHCAQLASRYELWDSETGEPVHVQHLRAARQARHLYCCESSGAYRFWAAIADDWCGRVRDARKKEKNMCNSVGVNAPEAQDPAREPRPFRAQDLDRAKMANVATVPGGQPDRDPGIIATVASDLVRAEVGIDGRLSGAIGQLHELGMEGAAPDKREDPLEYPEPGTTLQLLGYALDLARRNESRAALLLELLKRLV